ncbi:type IV secretory system conjugative DNA transfer family protein, partial [bacterium]|nr:type IV secretory system conjugative DNA transfer family protein [bacterium]
MDNEQNRFGSAAWANEQAIKAAGLFEPKGPQIGYFGQRPLYLDGDAPMITIGGAGSGKLRDLLAYAVCKSPGQRMLTLDPRGELGAISIHVHAANGEYAYFWNPMGTASLPQHRCNPLDILKADSPHFHSDCKFIAEGLIPLSGGASGKYFELRAREWLEAPMKSRVERKGRTSLPDLYRIINAIESDPAAWGDQLDAMLSSRFGNVRRCAAEMLTKQQDSPKEFGAVMGEIYAYMSFLDDPVLRESLEEPDFSLEALCAPDPACKVFLNIPAEYLSIWSPLVRLFFTVTMLYKPRFPDRPRVMLIADEAGQLGRFEALLRSFTYGRGAGIRAWAIFQDTGQIVRNFGSP